MLKPVFRICNLLNSDPDPAKILNPDPEDPWIRIRILAIFLHYLKIIYNYFIIIILYHIIIS